MNKVSIAKLNMYQAVQQVLNDNNAFVTTLSRLDDEVQLFNQLVSRINALNTSLSVGTKGITNSNTQLKLSMVDAVCKLARVAFVWAKDERNIPFTTLFNVTRTDFTRLSDIDCYAKANAVFTPIETNAHELTDFNVKPSDITAARQMLNIYQASLGKTQSALKTNKSMLAETATVFKQADASLVIITDLVVNVINSPAFSSALVATKVINEAAIRKTGITIKVINAASNSPVTTAIAFVEGSTKTDEADQQGICELLQMRPGQYILHITAAGYITQDVQVTVEQGKITPLQISLNKAA